MKKKKTLKDFFDEYDELTFVMRRVTFDYSREIDALSMLPWRRDIYKEIKPEEYDAKENELKQSIDSFENQIIGLIQDNSKFIKSLCKALKRENAALTEKSIATINSSHYWIEFYYTEALFQIAFKRKYYSDVHDFSNIDFSELEAEKKKLSSAINEYNENILKSVDYKMTNVFDIRKQVKENKMNALKELEAKI